ncbi:MAG: hypothetical protein M3140_01885 [Actinomycetota bacterium]|nr:hypothetical protein [Actinomycetota bacterium]
MTRASELDAAIAPAEPMDCECGASLAVIDAGRIAAEALSRDDSDVDVAPMLPALTLAAQGGSPPSGAEGCTGTAGAARSRIGRSTIPRRPTAAAPSRDLIGTEELAVAGHWEA